MRATKQLKSDADALQAAQEWTRRYACYRPHIEFVMFPGRRGQAVHLHWWRYRGRPSLGHRWNGATAVGVGRTLCVAFENALKALAQNPLRPGATVIWPYSKGWKKGMEAPRDYSIYPPQR